MDILVIHTFHTSTAFYMLNMLFIRWYRDLTHTPASCWQGFRDSPISTGKYREFHSRRTIPPHRPTGPVEVLWWRIVGSWVFGSSAGSCSMAGTAESHRRHLCITGSTNLKRPLSQAWASLHCIAPTYPAYSTFSAYSAYSAYSAGS